MNNIYFGRGVYDSMLFLEEIMAQHLQQFCLKEVIFFYQKIYYYMSKGIVLVNPM